MAGIVAKPASEPKDAAATPWAIAHGIAMILGGASIMFATANAFLYLVGRRKLKQKRVTQVLGRVPNIEKLERLTVLGLRGSFVLITFGLVSGIGLAVAESTVLDMSALDWLTDTKIVVITTAWLLLGALLVLRRVLALKNKTTAHVTIIAFLLILFAIVGTSVCCRTQHDFAQKDTKAVEVGE
jgi:ABC-type uncharacterized transport system permease subunit